MGHAHDLWHGEIEDFHNANSECMQDCIVYMYPFLWNTCICICATSVYYVFHKNDLRDRLVCQSVCPSVCFHDNSGRIRRRMMKPGTVILEIKSNIEFGNGSRALPLTRPNWRFYIVPIHIPVEYLYICACTSYYFSTSIFNSWILN